MLLRILWLVCLVWTTRSGPVTKIEDYSNDLRESENTDENLIYPVHVDEESNDFDDIDATVPDPPKIYEDIANLEEIQRPKSSYLRKRMVTNRVEDVKTAERKRPIISQAAKKEFMSYISQNIPADLPGTNLSDTNDVEKLAATIVKLYDQYVQNKMATTRPQDVGNDQMMSDQPLNDDSGFKKIVVPTFDESPVTSSESPYAGLTAEEILDRETKEQRNRTKEIYLWNIKQRILSTISRPNGSVPFFPYQFTIPFPAQAVFNVSDSPYTEKIRSFYPTCDVPKNTKDLWKEENFLNLFFNVDYHQNATIATATLRLHRLPRENQTTTFWGADSCADNNVSEEEKLLRVSIYWYVKSSKKHSKVKRRLCDSKMISENSPWVELSVKAATRTWTKSGKNMGLAILVEDQDGGTLKASKYFKGATCTVGTVDTPTPRPIPTLITDTARQNNDSTGIYALLGINENGSVPSDFGLLPKIDVCVLELPGQVPLVQLNKDDCDLKNNLNELSVNLLNHHHIRHQKHLENEHQHNNNNGNTNNTPFNAGEIYDFRSKIRNKKIILSRDMLEKLNNGSINR
ncbi:TGF-beta propeptide [Popillia japonica]|uniref:TGF-beta propeptide n=1 Tax=Popillia japonica TaxID=7064 RepID=A0AAW1N303_POPJA